MPWPTPQDYNEALQNPNVSFSDPELKQGNPELTAMGLPKPISGNFASVYRLQCGPRNYAVRCFIREFHDLGRRYAAISDHLGKANMPYTVGFKFLPDGIRVRGQWYPILKMEWVQGDSLSTYIDRNVNNSAKMSALANRLIDMQKALQRANIAHGDLQHGNIIVTNDDFKLIDYDGMYVPALSGQGSHEVGHRNYQHPRRDENDFGPTLDNFSAWVIFISLISLAIEPQLWLKFRRDEGLLIGRKDFESPEASPILNVLESHHNQSIQLVTSLIKSYLSLSPSLVPALDGTMLNTIRHPQSSQPKQSSWIDDHIKSFERKTSFEPIASPTIDPSWILEAIVPGDISYKYLETNHLIERIVVAATIVTIAFHFASTPIEVVFRGLFSPVIITLLTANVALWIYRFRTNPVVKEAEKIKAQQTQLTRKMNIAKDVLKAAEKQKQALMSDIQTKKDKVNADCKAQETKERKTIEASQNQLAATLGAINSKRQSLVQKETNALRDAQTEIESQIEPLTQQIIKYIQDRDSELTSALRAKQKQYVDSYLSHFDIEAAAISGLGSGLKARLQRAGYRTAANISYAVRGVEGIGWARAQALAAWRSTLETQAKSHIPSSLTQMETIAIRGKYDGPRQGLETRRASLERLLQSKQESIRNQFRSQYAVLDNETRAAKSAQQVLVEGIKASTNACIRPLKEELAAYEMSQLATIKRSQEETQSVQQNNIQLNWEKARIALQLRAYERITFLSFIGRIFSFQIKTKG